MSAVATQLTNPQHPGLAQGPMKVGVTFLYTIFKHGNPPPLGDELSVLKELAELGFHYLELEGLGKEHQDNVYAHKDEYKHMLDDLGMHVHNFCSVNRDLVHLNKDKRQAAYDEFKRGAEIAALFESETLHVASYTPAVHYSTGTPYAASEYEFQQIIRAEIPEGFDWQEQWDVLVESVSVCSDIAAEHGKCIIMEPRVGEIICSSDSMLRLIEQVNRPNLYANFDTAHFHAQREVLSVSLEKLKGKYANIHLADNNQLNTEHICPGKGTIDWEHFFKGLMRQQYGGYLGLDLGGKETIADDLLASWRYLEQLGDELGFEIIR